MRDKYDSGYTNIEIMEAESGSLISSSRCCQKCQAHISILGICSLATFRTLRLSPRSLPSFKPPQPPPRFLPPTHLNSFNLQHPVLASSLTKLTGSIRWRGTYSLLSVWPWASHGSLGKAFLFRGPVLSDNEGCNIRLMSGRKAGAAEA